MMISKIMKILHR